MSVFNATFNPALLLQLAAGLPATSSPEGGPGGVAPDQGMPWPGDNGQSAPPSATPVFDENGNFIGWRDASSSLPTNGTPIQRLGGPGVFARTPGIRTPIVSPPQLFPVDPGDPANPATPVPPDYVNQPWIPPGSTGPTASAPPGSSASPYNPGGTYYPDTPGARTPFVPDTPAPPSAFVPDPSNPYNPGGATPVNPNYGVGPWPSPMPSNPGGGGPVFMPPQSGDNAGQPCVSPTGPAPLRVTYLGGTVPQMQAVGKYAAKFQTQYASFKALKFSLPFNRFPSSAGTWVTVDEISANQFNYLPGQYGVPAEVFSYLANESDGRIDLPWITNQNFIQVVFSVNGAPFSDIFDPFSAAFQGIAAG